MPTRWRSTEADREESGSPDPPSRDINSTPVSDMQIMPFLHFLAAAGIATAVGALVWLLIWAWTER